MDRDTLYFHFANMALAIIGLLSIQAILNPFIAAILILGTVAGFVVSWQMKGSRPQHIDTFIGALSLAAVVIILGRLYNTAITFENLIRIFSIALAWLTLFQSFGLRTGKSYAIVQFISACLLISSCALALEQEMFYITLLSLFLFIFIFTMRLDLVCAKKRKGSLIIGDQEAIMSLWQQIKVGAVMFSLVLIVASFMYPLVPRFENLSLKWIPSTLLSLSEQIPLLKLIKDAPKTIKENIKARKEQIVDDEMKKRETSGVGKKEDEAQKEQEPKEETVERFSAKGFNKDIDVFEIESLEIKSDTDEVPLDSKAMLEAELKLSDGSTIPATRLVDWKVRGTAKVSIDGDGNLTAKEKGFVSVSAIYLGNFSNDVEIKITEPLEPIKKKSRAWHVLMILFWLLILALSAFIMWVFVRSRRLSEMAIKNPREFIKEIYDALCRGFKIYGMPRFDYLAHREFFESVKGLLSSKPAPMDLMTEGVLEARFSTHEISREHSQKTLGLFHEVKDVIMQRPEGREFWKKGLFGIFLLEVLLLPRQG